ncbi:MAG TPA: DUF86 domain-containing protein [Clostridiaceae bacterium]|nr:DUF86 domain-containing protein [Clostridiaceae bacterium]
MMNNFEVIVEKLLKLQKYIEQIEKIKPSCYEEYISEITVKYAIERIMQLIVDTALDINNILLAYNNKPPAPDYYNSFIEVAECGVFDSIFAISIAPSTGLRNRLVHEYEKVSDEIVFNSINKFINLYKKYLSLIFKYIEEH